MNDDMQKTMQFILEQQAQFAVNLHKTEERVARLEENMAEMARAQTEMARAQTHMNEVVAVMADTHTHTEVKLDAFIGVLERYISSNKNGNDSGNGDT